MKRLQKDGGNSRNSLCLLPSMLYFPHTCTRAVGIAPECLKNSQNHQAYLLRLDKLWTPLRVWTDRAGEEFQQEKGDHLAATMLPKYGDNGRLPQAAQHTYSAGKGSSNLTSSKTFSSDLQLLYASHSLYVSLQHKGESCSFLENHCNLQLWDDQN